MGTRAKAGALITALLLLGAAAAGAVTVQEGGLRMSVLSQIKPYKLPRDKPAPIAVFVSGHLENVAGGVPPQLQKMTIDVNRNGLLQSKGLPVCQIPQVQPASTERALSNCGDALIGSGQFWANIVLPDQGAYRTEGKLLIFNGKKAGKPVILAHIYTSHPFNTSFVIPFSIKKISKGTYGTRLSASLPQALGTWGYLDRIKLTLRRKYTYRGKQMSYFNAACAAPKGAKRTSFPLAFVDFSFAGMPSVAVRVEKTCGVKG